ncbi:hypothetical protein [Brachymonas sp.]|uniref:hypothetical protein n=1 Tax=Brachymonas sp. TaxID=1936292 RepID=UPI0035B46EFB
MLEYLFMAAMGLLVIVGVFCASRLDRSSGWGLLLAFLSPALAALYTLGEIFGGDYEADWPDLLRALAMLGVYFLAARPPMRRDAKGDEQHILDDRRGE